MGFESEMLETAAEQVKRTMVEDIRETGNMSDEEAATMAGGITWTGITRQHKGTTYFEFLIPGTWHGRGYAALVDGEVFSREPEDIEGADR